MAFGASFFVALDPGGGVGDHQIVEDAALVIEQQRIAHPARLQRGDGARQQLFQFRSRILARDHQLAHMADIEQARLVARPVMLGDDAAALFLVVLDRHLIAREGHHARALLAVPGIQRQHLGGFGRIAGVVAHIRPRKHGGAASGAIEIHAPSVGKPESLADHDGCP